MRMRGPAGVPGALAMRGLALAALELGVEGVVRRRPARARRRAPPRLALEADDHARPLREAVLHLDELAVGHSRVHADRLGLALVVRDEDEGRARAAFAPVPAAFLTAAPRPAAASPRAARAGPRSASAARALAVSGRSARLRSGGQRRPLAASGARAAARSGRPARPAAATAARREALRPE